MRRMGTNYSLREYSVLRDAIDEDDDDEQTHEVFAFTIESLTNASKISWKISLQTSFHLDHHLEFGITVYIYHVTSVDPGALDQLRGGLIMKYLFYGHSLTSTDSRRKVVSF